ncbi:MAG: tetratricopeptide repeat protein, partial [Candidatus Rokubacteria bacterium]|nr:tetratricopeptide repeat protein [Candidatus Rokubacteria bacterium]
MRVPPAPALSTSRAGRSATAIFSAPSWYSRTTVDPTGRSRHGRLSLTRTIAVLLLLPFLLAATGLAAEHEALVDEPPALKGSRSAAEHVERARALIGRGEPAAAVPLLREALRLDPSLTDARSSLGFALLGIGDVDGGIEELRAVLRRDPDAVAARVHLATALMARQDWTAARGELDQALRREPRHLHAQYALGVVRYTLGDLAGAIDAYREVLAAAPEHHDARFNLALTLKLAH